MKKWATKVLVQPLTKGKTFKKSGLYYENQELLKYLFSFLWFLDIFIWILIKWRIQPCLWRKSTFSDYKQQKKEIELSSILQESWKVNIPSERTYISSERKHIPVMEQHKSPMRELSLSPVREDHSPVTVTSKAGKKWQGESIDQE